MVKQLRRKLKEQIFTFGQPVPFHEVSIPFPKDWQNFYADSDDVVWKGIDFSYNDHQTPACLSYCKKDYITEIHRHKYTEVIVALKGPITVTTAEKSTTLSEGESIIIPAYVAHKAYCYADSLTLAFWTLKDDEQTDENVLDWQMQEDFNQKQNT